MILINVPLLFFRGMHEACCVFAVVLSFIGVLVWSAPAIAIPLTATFDSFSEGDTSVTFTDGGITFSDLDERIGTVPDSFSIESTDSSLFGPSFSPPNYLTTEGFAPGSGFSFGRFGSARITPQIEGTVASLDIFSFSGSPNILTVEALLNGTLVASDFITFDFGSGVLSQALTISSVQFDELKLVASGSQDDGVIFIGIDNVSITPVPEPTTIALLGIGLAGLAGVGVRRKWKRKTI